MPVGPHIFALLEAALTDSFQYHNELDAFLMRAGVAQARLTTIRAAADEGYKGQYPKTRSGLWFSNYCMSWDLVGMWMIA